VMRSRYLSCSRVSGAGSTPKLYVTAREFLRPSRCKGHLTRLCHARTFVAWCRNTPRLMVQLVEEVGYPAQDVPGVPEVTKALPDD
jgi:hypothetical protein